MKLVVASHVGDAFLDKHINCNTEGQDEDAIADYNQFLMTELLIRYSTRAIQYGLLSVKQRRQCLRLEILIEEQVHEVRATLARKEAVAQVALVVVEQAMPCLLHCENRVNEKISMYYCSKASCGMVMAIELNEQST